MSYWREGGSLLRSQIVLRALRCNSAWKRRAIWCSGQAANQTGPVDLPARPLQWAHAQPCGLYWDRSAAHRHRFVHSSVISDKEKIAKTLVESNTGRSWDEPREDSTVAPHHSHLDESTPDPFPFEGAAPKRAEGETGGLSSLEGEENDTPANDSFTVGRRDTLEGRFYHIVAGVEGSEFEFPSVTTVLESTMPPSNYYSLMNWRRGQIKEHGEEGYRRMNAERLRIGIGFHKVRIAWRHLLFLN